VTAPKQSLQCSVRAVADLAAFVAVNGFASARIGGKFDIEVGRHPCVLRAGIVLVLALVEGVLVGVAIAVRLFALGVRALDVFTLDVFTLW
jgi:hypothetical protein